MNKIITLIVLAVIVVGGGTAIILTNKDSKDSMNSSRANSSKTQTGQGNDFSALPTADLSFVATLTSTANGKTVKTVMESDAKTGAVRYASDTMTMIYTKDAYYICQTAENCFKYKLGQGSGASFNPKDYQYDSSKIDSYRNSSTKLGTESCPAGTCVVWQVTNGGYVSKIYVDSKTKRVSKVTSSQGETSTTIIYDYKDVSVQVPTNAKDISSFTAPGQ